RAHLLDDPCPDALGASNPRREQRRDQRDRSRGSALRARLGGGARGVAFTIAGPAPATVRARVTGAGRYYDCAVRLDGRWRCPLGGVPVGEADALSVVASA